MPEASEFPTSNFNFGLQSLQSFRVSGVSGVSVNRPLRRFKFLEVCKRPMMSSLVSQGLMLFIDTCQVPGSDIDIEVEFEVPISSWRCLRCTEVYDVLLESWLENFMVDVPSSTTA